MKTNHHLLFVVVTKPILRHAMCLKCGDENILRYLMCLKNRRQMKFWWEKEYDYGDTNKASPISVYSDETNVVSLNVLEIG